MPEKSTVNYSFPNLIHAMFSPPLCPGFIRDVHPHCGLDVQVLCEDHCGTYALPFPCQWTAEGWTSAELFQELRDRHFPRHLNIVPAHLTVFHKLPGAELAAVMERLRGACEAEDEMAFTVDDVLFLGRGVAFAIGAPRLLLLRKKLANGWRSWIGAQDGQPFRPHVTIQNKADPIAARALHSQLLAAPPAISGTIVGLDLWHYRGGPWEPVARYSFGVRLLAEK